MRDELDGVVEFRGHTYSRVQRSVPRVGAFGLVIVMIFGCTRARRVAGG